MTFKANQPIVIHNDLTNNLSLVPYFGIGLSIVLPRTENSTLYVGVKPFAEFKIGEGHPFVYKFQTQSEFFISPIYDIEKRDKQIYQLILTAISDFNDLLSLIDNPPLTLNGSEIIFETIPEEEAKTVIHKAIFINQSN
jgi:hypothetical protein